MSEPTIYFTSTSFQENNPELYNILQKKHPIVKLIIIVNAQRTRKIFKKYTNYFEKLENLLNEYVKMQAGVDITEKFYEHCPYFPTIIIKKNNLDKSMSFAESLRLEVWFMVKEVINIPSLPENHSNNIEVIKNYVLSLADHLTKIEEHITFLADIADEFKADCVKFQNSLKVFSTLSNEWSYNSLTIPEELMKIAEVCCASWTRATDPDFKELCETL
ncbi:hypothetical protein NPIL_5081 [Nephila pilipes]|uniref:Uncharacterized protein n=1 Tax=Nephila pilipes TaxID=299642 RepID=A0A8X6UIP1_NEPPI|nr:hypothetical protein NPIL_5081 [Nephila pilipes]